MKRGFLVLSICLLLVDSGCSTVKGIFGKNSQKQAQMSQKVADLDIQDAELDEKRLSSIGAWSSGVEYALDKETNRTPQVIAAKELNERVEALANKPDFSQTQEIQKIVDNLITNKINGEKLLQKKDKEIESLNNSIEEIAKEKQEEMNKAFEQAAKIAGKADSYQAKLGKMDSWGGLGAIWYGIKKLVVRMAWILGIGSILFIVLRVFAASNPIAGAIFSVFNIVFSWVIHLVQSLAPEAAKVAGFVEQKSMDEIKAITSKLVDAIQMTKEKAQATGGIATVDNTLKELNLSEKEETVVDDIKKKLLYK